MTRLTRTPHAIKIALLLACLGCAAPISAASAAAVTSKAKFTVETTQAYEQQLAGGQITAATFNTKVRSLHLTLTSGAHVLIHYAPHEESKLVAALKAKGITAYSEKGKPIGPAKAHKHKLRYIVGGAALVVIVLVVAVIMVRRRRRAAAEEH